MKFDGGQGLELALKKLGIQLEHKVATNALKASARYLLKKAKKKAPKRTGLLKKHFFVKALPFKSGFIEVNALVGTSYAHLVEFGSKKSAARPFLRPAFDENQEGMLITMAQEFEKQFKKL